MEIRILKISPSGMEQSTLAINDSPYLPTDRPNYVIVHSDNGKDFYIFGFPKSEEQTKDYWINEMSFQIGTVSGRIYYASGQPSPIYDTTIYDIINRLSSGGLDNPRFSKNLRNSVSILYKLNSAFCPKIG